MGEKERNEEEVMKDEKTPVDFEKALEEALNQEEPEEVLENSEEDKVEGTENTEGAEETAEEAADSEESENGEEKKSKSFFKKEKKKDKKDQQIEELNDRLMRNMAEFDNYRKRTEKEKAMMFELGAKDIIEKMLPVIDNFERGLASISEEEKGGAFAKGVEAIYKQMLQTLEAVGVKQIEAVGQEFDPNFHNAVMHMEDEEYGENIVVEEFQKGYMYKDTVVRHSMVKVAN